MNNNHNEDIDEFEAYQQFLELQVELKNEIDKLKSQYESCRCLNCRNKLIEGSVHLIEVNHIVAILESKICPDLEVVFTSANIKYSKSKNGIFALKKQ